MITAVDFGCYAIRSAWRPPGKKSSISLYSEKSEYVVLPNIERYRQLLNTHAMPRAECEDSLTVFGNQATRARWLSRMPSASIFNGGMVPADDPPARQMLDILSKAILPMPGGRVNLCAFTVPGSERRDESREFLSRLIRMRGYEPLAVSASESAMLAEGSGTSFCGVTVVLGAETAEISVSRLGVTLGTLQVPVGADWVDIEVARQFNIRVYDDEGNAWLDLEAVRDWKHNPDRNLRHPVGERESVLARLYRTVLDQVAEAAQVLLKRPDISAAIGNDRLHVLCCGGATQLAGFASVLTERFVDHDIAGRIQSVRTVDQPDLAVVRGALIAGELEARSRARAAA